MGWILKQLAKVGLYKFPEMVACPECQGHGRKVAARTGRSSSIALICKNCKGTGKVLKEPS